MVELPRPSADSELVELVLKFAEDKASGASKSGAPKTVKLSTDDLRAESALVVMSGLELSQSCAGRAIEPGLTCHFT